MSRRKAILGIGVFFLVALAGLLLFIFTPTSLEASIPRWITQVEKVDDTRSRSWIRVPGIPDTFWASSKRKLPMEMSEFSRKLKEEFRNQPEWKMIDNQKDQSQWTRQAGSDNLLLTAMPAGEKSVMVYIKTIYQVSWSEKAQAKIRSLFGAKN
jgi:hypothetical protein